MMRADSSPDRTSPRAGGPIRVLPAHVVNQIAAGEVVERPASVVKELIDNALDAGTMRIGVELERGGIELIRVSDDGCGLAPDQLELAVLPHATSKVSDAADLEHIATMGFRGEALASIASVSRFSMRSRRAEDQGATRLDVEGGGVATLRPEAGPAGTSVSVRNLFFNTPARRKFLKTPGTEQGHCADVVKNLAMAHPAVGFSLRADGRVLLELGPNQSPKQRALALLGQEMESQYVEAHADQYDDARGIALWGLVGLPSLARPTARWQQVFVNGRPVRDRTVQHALREAYRGLIEPGRHPAAMLMLEMSPASVDVNVHPTKSEVRFRDSGLVHRIVYHSVRRALQSADLAPTHGGAGGSGVRFEPIVPAREPKPEGTPLRDRFAAYFERIAAEGEGKTFDFEGLKRAVDEERERIEAEGARIEAERARVEAIRMETLTTEHLRPSMHRDAPGQGALEAARPAARLLQVHNSFVVTQDEQGVVIIDQHALHERVMFELLIERVSRGELESQQMLMPVVVETTAARIELAAELGGLMRRLGIELEPMGPTSLGVHAFPTLLLEKRVEPGAFVGELLEKAEEDGLRPDGGGSVSESALHEVLDMMACKAAVKAGDAMTESELEALLAMRERVERSSNCPHGRPTAIRLTIRELERQFGR